MHTDEAVVSATLKGVKHVLITGCAGFFVYLMHTYFLHRPTQEPTSSVTTSTLDFSGSDTGIPYEVVIAAFNENLTWVNELSAPALTVYQKGNASTTLLLHNAAVVQLKIIGRGRNSHLSYSAQLPPIGQVLNLSSRRSFPPLSFGKTRNKREQLATRNRFTHRESVNSCQNKPFVQALDY